MSKIKFTHIKFISGLQIRVVVIIAVYMASTAFQVDGRIDEVGISAPLGLDRDGLLQTIQVNRNGLDAPEDLDGDEVENYFLKIFGITLENVYWGEFHTHTNYSRDAVHLSNQSSDSGDSGNDALQIEGDLFELLSPWEAYEYARDVQHLDFVALSDHAELPNSTAIPPEHRELGLTPWESLALINEEYNEEGKFIIFPGYEYTNTFGKFPIMGSDVGYGHKNVIFKYIDQIPDFRYGSWLQLFHEAANTARRLWNTLREFRPDSQGGIGTALTIPHTPSKVGIALDLSEKGGFGDHRTDWKSMDHDFVRNVEIHSKWGSFEGPPPPDLDCPAEPVIFHYESGVGDPISVRNILYHRWILMGSPNFTLGFVGGTDNHLGKPGTFEPSPEMDYSGSVTGVIAPALTRDEIWAALWNRHTIAATTSPTAKRIPVLYALQSGSNHYLTGDIGVHTNTVTVRVLAPEGVSKIEIIGDGCIIHTVEDNQLALKIDLVDGRHYIYARVYFNEIYDDEVIEGMVWTSPIYLK